MQETENPYASPATIAQAPSPLAVGDENEIRRRQVLRRFRWPALGILVSSTAAMALFAWTLGTIFYVRLGMFGDADAIVGSPDFSDLTFYFVLFAIYLFLTFPICFFAALGMLQGKYRSESIAACLLCCLPGIAPGFPLITIFALAAFFRLRRHEVVDALNVQRVGKLANRNMRKEQLFWPASVLLFLTLPMGILMALPWVAAIVLHLQDQPQMLEFHFAMTARPLGWLWPLISYSSMLTIFLAAIQMLRGKGYPLCVAGATLALIPLLTPCFIVGIPFGIWASVLLWNKQTRAAFAEGN